MTLSASSDGALAEPFPYFKLWVLVLCQIGMHSCLTGMRMAAALQLLQRDMDVWAVGVVMAMFATAPVFLALTAGRMADRHGYHRPTRIAASLSFAGAVIASSTSHYLWLCLAAALCGGGSSFGLIALQRTAARLASNAGERMKVFGWIAIAPALASLIGPLGTGLLIDHYGFRIAFAALAILPLGTLLLSQWVPREQMAAPVSREQRRPAWDLLCEPSFRRLLFINWLVSASWDVHSFALPILGSARGMSASVIGAILAAYAVTSTLVRLLLIPLLANRLSQRSIILSALLLTAAVYAIYPWLGPAWAMALGTATLGVALGTIQPALMTQLHHVTPSARHGEGLAVRSVFINCSGACMPLLFGVLGAALGAASLFWLMSGVLLAGSWQARRLGAAGG